ncbi:hypothetical protein [Cytobacillus oceanisediminis]|uniref:hypothetical protein n=1 Tax=Cytobacillus oceanisediminis TaxID=665099 RepID=UPI0025518E07|nr:hypothetical protein [Cytobacillus oceanisediminis]MDK7664386.1 hypothetical protein [Cytobacillus oceanisediminis]
MSGVRRIFYDIATGDKIHEIGRTGVFTLPTIDQDIATFTALSERNRETFDVIELPFGAYQQDFAEARLIGVDLEKKIPLFAYPDPENPGQEITPPIPLSEEVKTLKNELAAVQGAVDFIILNY